MKKEDVLLAGAGVVCAALLVTAIVLRQDGAAGAPPGGEAVPTEAGAGAAETGAPAEGAAPSGTPAAAAAGEAPAAATPGAPGATPAESPSFISEQNRRDVLLFFEEAEGDSLAPEKRKIFLTASPADQAKQIVVELINGPHNADLLPTLPPETRLLGLYLDRAGTAFVDLSDDLVTLHPGGTEEEIATIFSLVDSLTYNLPEVKRVHLLINGEERETLKSHLDLKRDYLPDLSIVNMPRGQAR